MADPGGGGRASVGLLGFEPGVQLLIRHPSILPRRADTSGPVAFTIDERHVIITILA
jgi:hypothetical protein